jgi:hypothetical protein
MSSRMSAMAVTAAYSTMLNAEILLVDAGFTAAMTTGEVDFTALA